MQRILLYIILSSICSNTLAGLRTPNTTWELGGFVGSSYYLGELNTNHFLPANLAFGPRLRYNYDERISLKTSFSQGKIQGNDAFSKNSFKLDRNFNFSSIINELAFTGEFNFLPYSPIYKKSAISTPFLFLGLAYAHHNPKTNLDGDIISSQDLNIEDEKYSKSIFSIPFGIGLKMASNQFSFELTWGIRKTYSDYLDDVSTNYKDNSSIPRPDNIVNYTQYETLDNVKRGDQYTKDWYIFSGLSIMWSLTKEEICRDFK